MGALYAFSPIGWVHVIASSVSLLVGALVLCGAKGTARHRKWGRWYFYAMLVTNLTALLIYQLGTFFFPHWLAIITLLTISIGYWAISTKAVQHWLPVHLTCMVVSYYMLWGGAVNEAFLHIASLRQLAEQTNNQALGLAHFGVLLIFVVVLIAFAFGTKNVGGTLVTKPQLLRTRGTR